MLKTETISDHTDQYTSINEDGVVRFRDDIDLNHMALTAREFRIRGGEQSLNLVADDIQDELLRLQEERGWSEEELNDRLDRIVGIIYDDVDPSVVDENSELNRSTPPEDLIASTSEEGVEQDYTVARLATIDETLGQRSALEGESLEEYEKRHGVPGSLATKSDETSVRNETVDKKESAAKGLSILSRARNALKGVREHGLGEVGRWIGSEISMIRGMRISESDTAHQYEKKMQQRKAIVIALGCAAVAWGAYKVIKGFDTGLNSGAVVDPGSFPTGDVQPTIGIEPTNEPTTIVDPGNVDPTHIEVEPTTPNPVETLSEAYTYSPDSLTVSRGEGWYATFKEMGIPRDSWSSIISDNSVMGKLQDMGIAYRDDSLGGWGINMTPGGKMPQAALDIVREAAESKGINLVR